MNAWSFLALGILFEVIGTSCLKLSNGFSNWGYSSVCIACFVMALYFLSLSVKTLDVSVVYAIWSAVGISIISVIGIVFFNEQFSLSKAFFIALIVAGVLGLQLTTQAAE